MKKTVSTIVGSFILSLGMYFFLLQHNIAAGGISGLSLVISNVTGLNLGTLNLVLNAIVFIMGYFFVGAEFAKRSIISAATVSLNIILLENLFPDTIITNDPILNVIFGPLIVAIGLGIIFYNGGSSGGTDVIATIINKYTNTPIAASLMMSDMVVIILSMFVIGLEPTLYAALSIIIQTVMLDNVIQGLSRKIAIMVISDKYQEINDVLTKKYNRGVTLFLAEGGYTGRDKKILLTISTVRRYPIIREQILSIDDRAFMFTYTISEVLGEGFTLKQLS